jgi:hypothetical protein
MRMLPDLSHRGNRSAVVIAAFGVWGALVTGLVSVVVIGGKSPVARAVILMADGLVLLWIVIGGIAMRACRDRAAALVRGVRLDWRIKFVLFATVLALVEEAITTAMTNLAPAFGVPVGSAYITASANYLDVICCHSVVLFVPMFIGWALLLSRFDFSPNAVFICFGITGVLAESGSFGLQNLLNAGFWVFVYGLMIYLPAYTLPQNRATKKPRPWHFLAAILLPFLCVIPAAGAVAYLHPTRIHFPPIRA